MSKPKYISDVRMLQVMEFWMDKYGKKQEDFCNEIGYLQKNISAVKRGVQSFRIEHIQSAMDLIGNGNFNYIFGVESNMFRGEKKKLTPIQQIEQAIKELKNDKRNR